MTQMKMTMMILPTMAYQAIIGVDMVIAISPLLAFALVQEIPQWLIVPMSGN